MHSVLFVATISDDRHDWAEFAEIARARLSKCPGVEPLAENVWLLDLHESASAFGLLAGLAEQKGRQYRLLPFQHEPQWLRSGYDHKPTLVFS